MKHQAGIERADNLGALAASLPKWVAWTVIAWQAGLSIPALAGKGALPSLLMRFERQASYWEIVCWIAGLLGILFGLYSRHLLHRQRTKEDLSLEAIERQLQAVLGSPASGATPTTNPSSGA